MALSDALFEASEGLREYTDNDFYRTKFYDTETIRRAEQIIELCDELRKELDRPLELKRV